MARPFVTLVICSIDAQKFERCVAGYRQHFASDELEIFGIHDATSLASAYNWAARRANRIARAGSTSRSMSATARCAFVNERSSSIALRTDPSAS